MGDDMNEKIVLELGPPRDGQVLLGFVTTMTPNSERGHLFYTRGTWGS